MNEWMSDGSRGCPSPLAADTDTSLRRRDPGARPPAQSEARSSAVGAA